MTIMRLNPSLFATLLLPLSGGAQGADLSPGEHIPALTLPTAREHKALSTDSFLGKKTVLHVFASW